MRSKVAGLGTDMTTAIVRCIRIGVEFVAAQAKNKQGETRQRIYLRVRHIVYMQMAC